MIEYQGNKMAELLINQNIITPEDHEVYSYGLQLMIATVLKGSALIVIALFLNLFKEFIVFIVFFSILRVFAGGYHSKSYLNCFITTAVSIFTLIGLSNAIQGRITTATLTGILVICCTLVYKYAPVESYNKPLSKEQKEKFRKKSIQIVIIESIAILLLHFIYPQFFIYCVVATLAITLASFTLIPLNKIVINH